jgi:hypothetical protein
VLREFVNRQDHRVMFQRMVRRDEEERILFVNGLSGMGKTTLLRWCEAWCTQQKMPWGEVDFLEPRPWDYAHVLGELASGLTAWLLPGEAQTDVFTRFKGLAAQTAAGGDPRAIDSNARRAATHDFMSALAGLPHDRPVAIFLDALHALDQAPDLRDWLWQDLLPAFLDKALTLSHVALVMADRAAPPPDPDARWYHTLCAMPLKPLTHDDFIDYARRRGFRKEEEEELGRYYDIMASTLEAEHGDSDTLTPRMLSKTLDSLDKKWHK